MWRTSRSPGAAAAQRTQRSVVGWSTSPGTRPRSSVSCSPTTTARLSCSRSSPGWRSRSRFGFRAGVAAAASDDARRKFALTKADAWRRTPSTSRDRDVEQCDALTALAEAYMTEIRGDLAWQYYVRAAAVADASPDIPDLRAARLISQAVRPADPLARIHAHGGSRARGPGPGRSRARARRHHRQQGARQPAGHAARRGPSPTPPSRTTPRRRTPPAACKPPRSPCVSTTTPRMRLLRRRLRGL